MNAILISSLSNFLDERTEYLKYLKQNQPWEKTEINTTIMLIEHSQFILAFLNLIK